MKKHELDALVASATPERVHQLALKLESQQPAVNRGTVPLYEVLDALTADLPLRSAAERSPIEMRLRKVVIAAVGQIKGLTFVEGDG